MKSNAIVRIVLFSLAILLMASILLGVLLFDSFSFIDSPTEQIQSDTVTADIRNIEIEWVAGSITFQTDPSITEIAIHEESSIDSKYQMVLKQVGQTLKIQYSDEKIKLVGINASKYSSKNLVITIPSGWICNSLEIDTASAEVIMENMTIREFDFDGASGDCRITSCDIGQMDMDTASGDIYFSGLLNTLDCDAASADCTIEVTNIPSSIQISALSGNLDLILPPDAGFTCVSDSMSGSIDTDFAVRRDTDGITCGDGSCKIKLSALSGDVSILKGLE